MTNQLDSALAQIEKNQSAALERLFRLMEISSISTDPAYKQDCLRAAELAGHYLEQAGFDVEICPTEGHPMVIGKSRHNEISDQLSTDNRPHILFYGHYDVQPVDPLSEWESPPFEPCLKQDPVNGQIIFGRGSSDDKGQLMTFVEAMRAFYECDGALPLNITVLLEGEEECGSPSLPAFLNNRGEDIKADLALICDTLQWDKDTPAITSMLRGLAAVEITIEGPSRDLHSGMYGGPAANPIRALSHLLGTLHDENGKIVIEGFYDDILPLPTDLATSWRSLDFNETEFLSEAGLTNTAGERDYSLLEQLWARPTLEINGIWGGYQGPGVKTVIPSKAHAKISFRLVPGQDPETILSLFKQHLLENLPADYKLSFENHGGSPAISFDINKPWVTKAAQALSEQFGKQAVKLGCGGSIPIVEAFKTELGMECLLIGFAVNDDRIHAPNEKYNLSSFTNGIKSWVKIIHSLKN